MQALTSPFNLFLTADHPLLAHCMAYLVIWCMAQYAVTAAGDLCLLAMTISRHQ